MARPKTQPGYPDKSSTVSDNLGKFPSHTGVGNEGLSKYQPKSAGSWGMESAAPVSGPAAANSHAPLVPNAGTPDLVTNTVAMTPGIGTRGMSNVAKDVSAAGDQSAPGDSSTPGDSSAPGDQSRIG